MTQDISREAYRKYVKQNEMLRERYHLIQITTKTYEEWVDITLAQDHPRWPEYTNTHRAWKSATFHLRYGPHAGREDTLPKFPSFSEWLEQKHPDEKETTA